MKLNENNALKIKLNIYKTNVAVTETDKTIKLNQYASELFAFFKIEDSDITNQKGVFIFTKNMEPIYIGMTTQSLKKVIMTTYGSITPRNIHYDGQVTACHLSSYINKNIDQIELFFIPNRDSSQIKIIKQQLVNKYNPILNL